MEIPPSLTFSVSQIEKMLGTEIEALVVPALDIDKFKAETGRAPHEKVRGIGYISGEKPLVTMSVADCNAVVLFGNRTFTLFHEYSGVNHKLYLPECIRVVRRIDNDLSAIQIAGDEEAFSKIRAILDRCKIPVVKSYRDGWNTDKKFDLKDGTGQKDIYVFPKERRVILNRRFSKLFCGEMVELSENNVLYEE